MEIPSRLPRDERASVAVEFALFLPLLLLLIFGVVELGSAWYSKQMLVNASREGARYGSLLDAEVGDTEVEQYVSTMLSGAGFPGTVQVSCTGASSSAGTLVTVQVNSSYQLPVLGALLPSGLTTLNLSATTVMRHE